MTKKNDVPTEQKEVKRVTEYRNDTRLRSGFMKNATSAIGSPTSNINNNLLGSQFKDNFLGNNLKKSPSSNDDDYIMPSQ